MASTASLCTLPNELLLAILNILPTRALLPLALVSHRFHAVILRLIQNRLALAANLTEHTLLLECYHPSAKLTQPPLYCTYLGTEGLAKPELDGDDDRAMGRLGFLNGLYSRFRPLRKEPDTSSSGHYGTADELVTEIVSLEAGEGFTQHCVVTNLVKVGPRRGLFMSFIDIGDGVLRIWREWLAEQATLSPLQSPTPPSILDDYASSSSCACPAVEDTTKGQNSAENSPRNDTRVLWVNNSSDSVGIKFRVKERRWRRDNPILFQSDDEVAVSYSIEYEELLIRTTHLLLKVEKSLLQEHNHSGKAVVFGSFLEDHNNASSTST
ncbi:hypothetical protein B0A49_12483 [Cryomyces minteri]|uniref:F-box domain-containing protein n=2 Tax=Cryomyces minteri TaxID=331657 RepID=A0A4U0VYM5_9PEZI|nr:hypothetical protein B0A49_12483 [Cryomyces minteri]